ncbi:hypothetical protein SUGI_0607070 [Cryptomeria japonica]|nr:hypothetical protein SUGI_0607070 [Cryptomeria japonica]
MRAPSRLRDGFLLLQILNRPVAAHLYVSLLQEALKTKNLSNAKLVHAHMIEKGFVLDDGLWKTLLHAYVACPSLHCARRVFNQMPTRNAFSWTVLISAYNGQIDEAVNVFSDAQDRDVISWNIIIAGFDKSGLPQVALMVFSGLHRKGIQLNEFIFKSVLTACSRMSALEQGMQIHANIIKCGVNMLMTACSFLKIPSTKYGLVSLRLLLMPRMVLFKEAYEPSMTYEGH